MSVPLPDAIGHHHLPARRPVTRLGALALIGSIRFGAVAPLPAAAVLATSRVAHHPRLPADAVPAGQSLMFRGDAAHDGVSTAPCFRGKGGIAWKVATNGAVRSSPAVFFRGMLLRSAAPSVSTRSSTS